MTKLNIKSYCIIGCLCVFTALGACKKYETVPLYTIEDDLTWDQLDSLGTLAAWFLNDVYTYLPTGFNRVNNDYLDAATDDAMPSRNNTTVQYFTNGRINVLNNPDAVWGNSYYGIRRANIYLKNVDKVPNTGLKTYGKAEARFLRVMFYFELLKRYGGVPLIGDTVFTLNDKLELPRNSFEQCVNYIVSECDDIKTKLRVESAISDGDWGHAPRGAAIALKARVLLYAASPLMNGGGVESNASLKALTGYPSYDASRWQKALDAANELIALNYYALYSSFGTMFTTKKNTEVILAKQRANGYDVETTNAPMGYQATGATSYGYTSPTQELVDAFPMLSGLGINETGSGYNTSDPYTNRDPRLGFTVFYNNYLWLNRNVQTFEGGVDKPGGNAVQTKTGYYLRKAMYDFSKNQTYTNQSHNFIIFRYAEILLNKAEALNELNDVEGAVTVIGLLRKRAGITAGTDSRYGIKAAISQTDMRTLIQNERRIELAFEEHRFWDVRRWKIANTVLNSTVHGMKITKNPVGGALTYQRVDAGTLSFVPQKMYHMPIPYSEISKNISLLQNEGW